MDRIIPSLPLAALTLASVILAAEPLRWLVHSWQDPAYQSTGYVYCAALAVAMLVSVRSGTARQAAGSEGIFVIFLAAAALRLLGQVLAVNILSALAVGIDVYAIARLLRLNHRPIPLSTLWLAAFFLFSLPLAPILERVLGFPLQMISARVSCAMLTPFFGGLECHGVRLKVNEADVLVDLPCAGASGLLLMLALWTAINAWRNPRLGSAFLGLLAVLAMAVLGNGLRISLLAAGLGLGIDTMAPAAHSGIGILSLAATALPVILFYRPAPRAARLPKHAFTLPKAWRLPLSLGAVIAALLIVSAPKEPFDRSGAVSRRTLPAQLLGHVQTPAALTPFERRFFEINGGFAQRASYGAFGLNVVQTGSPLRHLHAPETCLLGMGYEVAFLGTRFEPVPSSVYRATAPDGQAWLVSVSFVSEDGHQTASVGEAVWTWLTGRSQRWMSVQRITPISLPPDARAAFEQAALAALDL